jgi:hypothetical protein
MFSVRFFPKLAEMTLRSNIRESQQILRHNNNNNMGQNICGFLGAEVYCCLPQNGRHCKMYGFLSA